MLVTYKRILHSHHQIFHYNNQHHHHYLFNLLHYQFINYLLLHYQFNLYLLLLFHQLHIQNETYKDQIIIPNLLQYLLILNLADSLILSYQTELILISLLHIHLKLNKKRLCWKNCIKREEWRKNKRKNHLNNKMNRKKSKNCLLMNPNNWKITFCWNSKIFRNNKNK